MARFVSTRELETQAQRKNFKKQTGHKAAAMKIFGYEPTGKKSKWSKYLGGSPGMIIGGNIAAQGSDAEEVLESQRGAELQHQLGVVDLVKNIYSLGSAGGGGGGGAAAGGASGGAGAVGGAATTGTSAIAGGGGGATKAGGFISKLGGGTGEGGGLFKNAGTKGKGSGTSMFAGENGQKLTDKLGEESKKMAMDSMESDAAQSDALPSEDDYDVGEEAKTMKGYSDSLDALPLVGQAAGLYTEKMMIAKAHENKISDMSRRTYSGNEAHRA